MIQITRIANAMAAIHAGEALMLRHPEEIAGCVCGRAGGALSMSDFICKRALAFHQLAVTCRDGLKCRMRQLHGGAPMILGMTTATYTLLHVLISLLGIASGLVVMYGFITARRLEGWNKLFLATTVLTSLT